MNADCDCCGAEGVTVSSYDGFGDLCGLCANASGQLPSLRSREMKAICFVGNEILKAIATTEKERGK